MPTGFFTLPETSMIAKSGDTDAAFTIIKDTIFARYSSLIDPDDIRRLLNLIKFSVDTGPSAYFAKFREVIGIASGITGSDIVPLTILSKIWKDIPTEISEFMLLNESLEDRESMLSTCDFTDI